jgi:hypothetical protein
VSYPPRCCCLPCRPRQPPGRSAGATLTSPFLAAAWRRMRGCWGAGPGMWRWCSQLAALHSCWLLAATPPRPPAAAPPATSLLATTCCSAQRRAGVVSGQGCAAVLDPAAIVVVVLATGLPCTADQALPGCGKPAYFTMLAERCLPAQHCAHQPPACLPSTRR